MYQAAENRVSSMQSLPSPLTGLGRLGHRRYGMRVERADAGRVYLHTGSYLRPWTVFELYLWLDESSAPLYVLATVTAIEHQEDGYHLLANLTGIEQQDNQRWLDFCRSVRSQVRPSDSSQAGRHAKRNRQRRILLLDDALSDQVQQQLRERDVRIDVVRTLRHALHSLSVGCYDAVLANLDHPECDGRTLAKEVSRSAQRAQTQLILLSPRGLRSELDAGLAAGAHVVMSQARPEAHLTELLYARLLAHTIEDQAQTEPSASRERESGWMRFQRLFLTVSDTMTMYLRGSRGRSAPATYPDIEASSHAA